MVFLLYTGLIGIAEKVRVANVLSNDELEKLRNVARDYEHLLQSGIDIHEMAEKEREKSKANFKATVEDSFLHMEAPFYLSVGDFNRELAAHYDWPSADELIRNRRDAISRKRNAVYHSVQLIMAFENVTQTTAQKMLAEKTGRELSDIKSSYSRERKRVTGR